jgi:hypothetical protein
MCDVGQRARSCTKYMKPKMANVTDGVKFLRVMTWMSEWEWLNSIDAAGRFGEKFQACPPLQMCLCGSLRLWRLLGVLHVRLGSDDLKLATLCSEVHRFNSRGDHLVWVICRLNLLHSFKRRDVDSWCDRMSQFISSLAVRLLHAALYYTYAAEWKLKWLHRPIEMYKIFNPEIPGLEPPNPRISGLRKTVTRQVWLVFTRDDSVDLMSEYAVLGYYTKRCTKSLISVFRLSLNVKHE